MKTVLTLGLLALGAMAASGPAEARPQANLSGPRIATGSYVPPAGACIPGQPCQQNQQYPIYRAPVPGQAVMLNPQPLPPKELLLRR